jgi:NTP pyrophosphatase (non-canonical NTP hydrolase)
MTETQELLERIRILERLLQLEVHSADLMDALISEWACNMRSMARHNVALEDVLIDILILCDCQGISLGSLGKKAELILSCEEPDASE